MPDTAPDWSLFDLADFEPKPTYQGTAPLNFTRDYFHPDDLIAAHRWLTDKQGMSFGSAVGRVHTWRPGITTGWVVPEGVIEHCMCMLTCSLDCFGIDGHGIDYLRPRDYPLAPEEIHRTPMRCTCVRGDLHQVICTTCEWHHIDGTEQGAVEAWHDHAFPGWRDLPVLPLGFELGGEKAARKRAVAWVEEHYPVGAQTQFAPVLTERKNFGRRSVPGRSPWGGFDICGRVIEEES